MASGWDEHKAELEWLYLRAQPTNTIKQIKGIMESAHAFTRSEKSYERQFKTWGFRKNMKSSYFRDIHHTLKIRKFSGKASRVFIHGSLLDLEDPKIKRKISRNAPLLSARFSQKIRDDSSISVVGKTLYIHSPPTDSYSPTDFFDNLPWFGFQSLLLPDARLCLDLDEIASQMANQSKHLTPASGTAVPARLSSNSILSTSMLSNLPQQITLHRQTSLAQHTRNCDGLLRALVPEPQEVFMKLEETSWGTPQLANGDITPYFSLLVYLASNNLLNDEALDSMVDYAENLIKRRQFKAMFSRTEPSIRSLLDTLLSSAVRIRNMTVIDATLSAGAYPNVHVAGYPALVRSASQGDTEVMKRLLESGADPHVGEPAALVAATQSGCVEAVKLLLEAGGFSQAQTELALDCAIRGRKSNICRMILDANTDLDVNSCFVGCTFLQQAVLSECKELVELFVNCGANLNAPAAWHSRVTALQAAVWKGNIAIASYLLKLGADVNQKSYGGGKTAIQYAIQENSEELFVLLLEAGAEINSPAWGIGGRTALQLAAENSDISFIKLLLEAHADVNAPAAPNQGMTALQAAAKMGRREVVELFLNHGADVNAPGAPKSGMTALQAAARIGDIVLIRLLLEYGGDILAPASEDGATVLESAIAYDEIDLANILCGGNIETYNSAILSRIPFEVVQDAWYKRGFPFVHMMLQLSVGLDFGSLCTGNALASAAKRLHDTNIDLMEFLLDAGVAVDSREGISSPTALHLAVLHHDFPVVRALLEAGADIKLLWGDASIIQTALRHWAYNDISKARIVLDAWMLLQKGVGLGCVSPEFRSLDFQHEIQDNQVEWTWRNLLKAMGEEVNIESEERARGGIASAAAQWWQDSAVLVQMLLAAGADPNIRDESAPTPLQRAAHIGSAPLVRSLINAKADVNAAPAKCKEGDQVSSTALQAAIATRYFDLEVVHLLLDNGADLNAPAPKGRSTRTALQAAIETANSMEIIQLLLSRGADVNALAGPIRGATALQVAAIKGYVGLAVQLLSAGADVNAPSSYEGRTALEGAAELGRLDMVQVLLNAGGGYDKSRAEDYGTALSLAKSQGFIAVHDLIKAHFDKLKPDRGSIK